MTDARFIAAMGQLEKVDTNEAEALVALRFVNRMLGERGKSWSDVATMIVKESASAMPMGSGLDIFGDTFARSSPARRQQAPARPRKVFIGGEDVPELIVGRPRLVDERMAKNGPMMVIQVEEDETLTSYGPIVVFAGEAQAIVRAAIESKKDLRFGIRQPRDHRHMPSVTVAQEI